MFVDESGMKDDINGTDAEMFDGGDHKISYHEGVGYFERWSLN